MTPDDQLMDEMEAELGPLEAENLDRMANRPPDSTVDYVTSKMLELESRARDEIARRNAREAVLKAEIVKLEDVKASLVKELLAERAATRRALWLAAALFCGLCWREGWRVALRVWRWL